MYIYIILKPDSGCHIYVYIYAFKGVFVLPLISNNVALCDVRVCMLFSNFVLCLG